MEVVLNYWPASKDLRGSLLNFTSPIFLMSLLNKLNKEEFPESSEDKFILEYPGMTYFEER